MGRRTAFISFRGTRRRPPHLASNYGKLSAGAKQYCEELELAFISDGGRYRRFEQQTYYYENVFKESPEKIMLQVTCCIWVSVQARAPEKAAARS